jgi:hypothetical protein
MYKTLKIFFKQKQQNKLINEKNLKINCLTQSLNRCLNKRIKIVEISILIPNFDNKLKFSTILILLFKHLFND